MLKSNQIRLPGPPYVASPQRRARCGARGLPDPLRGLATFLLVHEQRSRTKRRTQRSELTNETNSWATAVRSIKRRRRAAPCPLLTTACADRHPNAPLPRAQPCNHSQGRPRVRRGNGGACRLAAAQGGQRRRPGSVEPARAPLRPRCGPVCPPPPPLRPPRAERFFRRRRRREV